MSSTGRINAKTKEITENTVKNLHTAIQDSIDQCSASNAITEFFGAGSRYANKGSKLSIRDDLNIILEKLEGKETPVEKFNEAVNGLLNSFAKTDSDYQISTNRKTMEYLEDSGEVIKKARSSSDFLQRICYIISDSLPYLNKEDHQKMIENAARTATGVVIDSDYSGIDKVTPKMMSATVKSMSNALPKKQQDRIQGILHPRLDEKLETKPATPDKEVATPKNVEAPHVAPTVRVTDQVEAPRRNKGNRSG